jgi:hypothetical protein
MAKKYKSAILCDHANETPRTCPCDCPSDCACRERMCKRYRSDAMLYELMSIKNRLDALISDLYTVIRDKDIDRSE